MVKVDESISIPRYVMFVVGPTFFSVANGIPICAKASSARCRLIMAVSQVLATKKKSSE